jgi:ComF family protein
MNLMQFSKDLFSLVYPKTCELCDSTLVSGETCICSVCWHKLPRTDFYRDAENPLTNIFWGRIQIETATALFHYHKGGKVQSLIHQLKYKGNQKTGRYLGERLGTYLSSAPLYKKLDVIIPVPLHEKRMRERGFNQSEVFGEGLSQTLGLPLNSKVLKRMAATSTQTSKRRFNRWQNVESVFKITAPQHLKYKNILLIDDVITTGSTIESCVLTLQAIDGVRVWVASIGFTQ